ncbi:hypothetical protein [Phyllobacterium sp. P5_D12]
MIQRLLLAGMLSRSIVALLALQFELAKSQAVMAEAQQIIKTGSWSWPSSRMLLRV